MIFADASFWLAYLNREERHHPESIELWAAYENELLLTSELVRGEVYDRLASRLGIYAARAFVHALDRSPSVRVEPLTPSHQHAAMASLRDNMAAVPFTTFGDAAAAAVMGSLRVRRALSFTGRLESLGFEVLHD